MKGFYTSRFCTRVFMLCFVIGLSACGGGGSDGTSAPSPSVPSPPPPSSSLPFSSFDEFEQSNGSLPAELSVATLESLIQLSYMAKTHLEAIASGSSLTCRVGQAAATDPSLSLVAGSIFTIEFDRCFNYIIADTLLGQYDIEITAADSSGNFDFVVNPNGLTIESFVDGTDSTITFAGLIEVQSRVSFESEYLRISLPNNANFQFDFSLYDASEIVTSLDVTRIIDYTTGRFTIDGEFSVESNLAELTYDASFTVPFTGYINTPVDSGELLIRGGRSDLVLEVLNSGYRINVDIGGNGSIETSPNTPSQWADLIEGVLFYDSRTAVSEDPEFTLFFSNSRGFRVIEITGFYEELAFGDLLIVPETQIRLLVSRPIDADLSGTAVLSDTNGNLIETEYEIQGSIVTISADLEEYQRYILSIDLISIDGDDLSISKVLMTTKPILAIANAPSFAEEGRSLTLDGKTLSRSLMGEIVAFEWQQLSGPNLSIASSQPIQNIDIPEIDSDYEEVSLLLEITDSLGFVTNTEFRFLIVSTSLNRHVVYIPFEEEVEKRVYLAKNNQVFVNDSENLLAFDYDPQMNAQQRPVFIETFISSFVPSGDAVLQGADVFGSLNSYYVAGIDVNCDSGLNLGPIAEELSSVVVSKGLERDELGEVKAINIQSGQYCSDHQQFRTEFGIYYRPDLFTLSNPGFIIEGLPTPISIESGDILNYSSSNNIFVFEETQSRLQAEALPDSSFETGSITISSDIYAEIIDFDIISNLSDNSLFYFEKSVNRSSDGSRPNAVFNFHELGDAEMLSVSSDTIADIRVFYNGEQHAGTVSLAFPGSGVTLNERIPTERVLDGSAVFMSTSYDSTTCEGEGWYELLEYQLDNDNQIASLAVDFYQSCSFPDTFNRGAVRLNSTIPVDFMKF